MNGCEITNAFITAVTLTSSQAEFVACALHTEFRLSRWYIVKLIISMLFKMTKLVLDRRFIPSFPKKALRILFTDLPAVGGSLVAFWPWSTLKM